MFEDYYQKDIKPFLEKIKQRVYETYKDDLGSGDVTTEAVVKPMKVKARIKSNGNGILAGVLEARSLFEKLGIEVKELIKEGSKIKEGDIVVELEGDAKKILKAERTALNFLIRLSGIASATHELVSKSKAKIAATRKTYFPYSDKRAVMIGGGYTHRLGLFDEYLIKDNHISAIQKEVNCSRVEAIEECLKRVKEHNKDGKPVEVEVENYEEALTAAKFKPDIIMLDGIDIPGMKKIVEELKGSGICLEVSGGITPKNIKDFEKIEVNVISSGYLTHSSRALDMSLEIVK